MQNEKCKLQNALQTADRVDHWPDQARGWRYIGPPLRPVAEDIACCTEIAQAWTREHGAPRVLLLGVTPELYRLPWPPGTDFLAADHTQAMIDLVWPGPKEAVLRAEWQELALPAASRDIVLCDGGLHLLPYPSAQRQLVERLRDIVADGGLCIFRLFVPPARPEGTEAVLADLLAGRIANQNILKLRLGMSLWRNAMEGVELAKVWQAFHGAVPDPEALAPRIGWAPECLHAIDTYRDTANRYHFVTVTAAAEMFSVERYELQQIYTPSYALGDRCPTVVFRRRKDAP